MTDALRKYLARLSNTKPLDAEALKGYQEEMSKQVKSGDVRMNREKRRLAAESRTRSPKKR